MLINEEIFINYPSCTKSSQGDLGSTDWIDREGVNCEGQGKVLIVSTLYLKSQMVKC